MIIKRFITNQYILLRDKIADLYSGMGRHDYAIFPSSNSFLAGRLNISPRKGGPYVNLKYHDYEMVQISPYSNGLGPMIYDPTSYKIKRMLLVVVGSS